MGEEDITISLGAAEKNVGETVRICGIHAEIRNE
jgi:hypothetical protein